MNQDEGRVLDEVLQSGLPCQIVLPSYNEALSLQARLNRYIRKTNEAYVAVGISPFEDLEVVLIKPRTLRFDRATKLKIVPGDGA